MFDNRPEICCSLIERKSPCLNGFQIKIINPAKRFPNVSLAIAKERTIVDKTRMINNKLFSTS